MADKNADRVVLGLGVCPVCTNPKAVFKVSTKQLAYCTCNACNTQIFSRSDVGDMALRGFVHAKQPAAAEPAPAADAKPEPTQIVAPEKTEKPKPAAPGWGFLGAFNG